MKPAAGPVSRPRSAATFFDRWYVAALVALDFAMLAVAAVLSMLGRKHLPFLTPAPDVVSLVAGLAAILVLVWLLCIRGTGGYSLSRVGMGSNEYAIITHSAAWFAAVVSVGTYLTAYPLSRGFFLLFLASGLSSTLAGRFVARRVVHRMHTRGLGTTRVLLAGDVPHLTEFITILGRERWLGYRVVGAVSDVAAEAELPHSVPLLGPTSHVLQAVNDTDAAIVIVGPGTYESSADLSLLARDFEAIQAQLVIVPSMTGVSADRVDLRPVAGLPLVFVEPPRSLAASKWAKRAFDLVAASLLLVLSSPLMLFAWIAVKLSSPGPVLFRQRRVGRDGELFSMLKFRSMVVDADSRLAQMRTEHLREGHVLFKLTDDPRITPIGRHLRRWSIDELPQLFNVVRGEMSLIGPRPALPIEVEQYSDEARRRLAVRPGLTGLWQVSGRSDLSWEDAVRLDVYYVDNWSMTQDIMILVRTIRAVFAGGGAY